MQVAPTLVLARVGFALSFLATLGRVGGVCSRPALRVQALLCRVTEIAFLVAVVPLSPSFRFRAEPNFS